MTENVLYFKLSCWLGNFHLIFIVSFAEYFCSFSFCSNYLLTFQNALYFEKYHATVIHPVML